MGKIQNKLLKKFYKLSKGKPLGVDLTSIDPIRLYEETQRCEQKDQLNKFGQICRDLEGLKQFVVPYYNSNRNKILSFRAAIFYNEFIQIQVFFEFIKGINSKEYPELNKIIQMKNNLRLNKIRNSITHFDWELSNGDIIFKDKNYRRTEKYRDISTFCSLISMIAIFMTNNVGEL